jgi:hypothetical protein
MHMHDHMNTCTRAWASYTHQHFYFYFSRKTNIKSAKRKIAKTKRKNQGKKEKRVFFSFFEKGFCLNFVFPRKIFERAKKEWGPIFVLRFVRENYHKKTPNRFC